MSKKTIMERYLYQLSICLEKRKRLEANTVVYLIFGDNFKH